jgi:hypothetical protein
MGAFIKSDGAEVIPPRTSTQIQLRKESLRESFFKVKGSLTAPPSKITDNSNCHEKPTEMTPQIKIDSGTPVLRSSL